MKIRLAEYDDIPECVALGKKFQELTRFNAYDYNAERVEERLKSVIDNAENKYVFFLAEDNEGMLLGALIGCLERHFFSDEIVASLIHYDVLPEKRMNGAALRLMIAFRKWAENRGAFELSIGVNSGEGVENLKSFFERLGFLQVGYNFVYK